MMPRPDHPSKLQHLTQKARPMNPVADHAKDYLTLLLTGLGITFLPHEFIGGVFLAFAGAAFAMKIDPEQDKRELWLVMLGAFLAAYSAVEVLQYAVKKGWVEEIPPQPVMAMAGFFSRMIMRKILRLGGLIDMRLDPLTDKWVNKVLPPDPRDGQEPRP